MKVKHFLFLMIIPLLLASCSAAKSPEASPPMFGGAVQQSDAMEAPSAAPQLDAGKTATYNSASAGSQSAVERIVIKNADLSIVVVDPAKSMNTITKMADDMGGFVVTSQIYKTRIDDNLEVPEANITIRVPADQLTTALDQIKALVENPNEDIINENVSGQDVTREYTDLKSRLTNLQNAEARLKEIMASATKTDDVMQVYNQLIQIQEQIEVLKGQIKYYDEASQMSAIAVRLQSQAAIKPLTIGGWQPVGVARDAVQALIDTLKFLANATIWIVIFCLPIIILAAIPGYFIWKGFRRWQIKRKLTKKEAEPKTDLPLAS